MVHTMKQKTLIEVAYAASQKQLILEREVEVDPFAVYRTLRVVNPSPYMIYMQGPGAILIASSPEILCRQLELHNNSSTLVQPGI